MFQVLFILIFYWQVSRFLKGCDISGGAFAVFIIVVVAAAG